MSTTRSHSQKEQAIKPHAIIVSHGQPSDPDPAEETLAQFTSQVAAALPDWQVSSATLAKEGALEAALEQAGGYVWVYPLFMTAGWFTQDALKKRLGDHPAEVLAPFGVDPGLPKMAADLLQGVLAENGWRAEETTLFIAAHGSGRSRNSARDTQAFAAALSALIPWAELRVGFVEEPPLVLDMAMNLGPKSICLPFFAAKGGHVIEDIPEALNAARFEGVCLDPIGCAPAIPALVADALRQAARVT